ncbi:hypothetical protein BNJ_00006 [Kaumoebavirus]|uniref:hypothetical protein n=1 Tax=Kaumoebavirus TaxID=1859492 RepID=UPI0009C2E390|nr:hypothetical protein BNJ_00006 [Kaumoebavirus]ARA71853.1 hypothetical protein BNJ_00006 [Kaumoebavirus]
MELISPELRRFLGRELCKDVVGIIEEYVAGQARRVAGLYRKYVKAIEWKIDSWGRNCTLIYYGEDRKCVVRCQECGMVQGISLNRLHLRCWSCSYEGCPKKYTFYMGNTNDIECIEGYKFIVKDSKPYVEYW